MKKRVPATGALLPGEASTIISVVAVLIGLAGAMALLGLAFLLFALLLGDRSVTLSLAAGFNITLYAVLAAAHCAAAIWLYQARRRGAYLAMGVLAISLLNELFGAARPSAFSVLLSVASLVGLALAWPHLSDDGREIEERIRIR